MIRAFFTILVISILGPGAPATAAGQPATPVTPKSGLCTTSPRTPEALDALLGEDYAPRPVTPLAASATPGELLPGINALPEGTSVDSTEVEAVAQDAFACLAAGDIMRYLAFFTDDAILRNRKLAALGMTMATPDLRTPTPVGQGLPTQTHGLFHARLLPDGRVAAVSPPGMFGLPELYVFVRENDRWLIDDIVMLGSEYAMSGTARTTFTSAQFVATGMDDRVIYGWGLEWGGEWTPVLDARNGPEPGSVMLTNGVSFVVAGYPDVAPGSDLAACVQPHPRKLASLLRKQGLDELAASLGQDLVPVRAADDASPQGADVHRVVAIYEAAPPADGDLATDAALRVAIECRTMAGGAWILGITHIAPAAAYEVEAARRDELLGSLEDVESGQE